MSPSLHLFFEIIAWVLMVQPIVRGVTQWLGLVQWVWGDEKPELRHLLASWAYIVAIAWLIAF